MKIIVTGSLGNISKPLTIDLVQKGHQVIVITSKQEKKNENKCKQFLSSVFYFTELLSYTGKFSQYFIEN